MEDKINVDDLVMEMSLERHLVAARRALSDLGVSYTTDAHGHIEIDDPDIYDLYAFLHGDDYTEAVSKRLKEMIVTDMVAKFAAEGIIEASHVDGEGNVIYRLRAE